MYGKHCLKCYIFNKWFSFYEINHLQVLKVKIELDSLENQIKGILKLYMKSIMLRSLYWYQVNE